MTTRISEGDVGVAEFRTEDFDVVNLYAGDFPRATIAKKVATSVVEDEDLPALTPMAMGDDGLLVVAKDESLTGDTSFARYITTAPIKMGLTEPSVDVFVSGMFNPEALNWDATFSTLAKKLVAFEASGAPIWIKATDY